MGGWPTAWRRPGSSASTAPSSTSTLPANRPIRWPTCLLARGVPFVFITGYQRDSIDRRYANVPVLQKPIDAAALESVLLTLLGSQPVLRAADGN